MIKKIMKKDHSGFTLIEMLIVLFVIAVLILIFVPNLTDQRKHISAQEQDAFEQVIINQVDLYELNEKTAFDGEFATLQKKGYLTKKQTAKALGQWKNIQAFYEATKDR